MKILRIFCRACFRAIGLSL